MKTTILMFLLMVSMFLHYAFAGPWANCFASAVAIVVLLENIYIRARLINAQRRNKKLTEIIGFVDSDEMRAAHDRRDEERIKQDELRKDHIQFQD